MAASAPSAQQNSPRITSHDVEAGLVPHWRSWFDKDPDHNFTVAIPSYDRPQLLCEATLPLLAKHGVPLRKVHVFVCPRKAPGSKTSERHRYMDTMRRFGYGDVNIEPGGVGLDGQMICILRRFRKGHLIVANDDVHEVKELVHTRQGRRQLRAIANGGLVPIFGHARNLMEAGNFQAWSLGCCCALRNMSQNSVSRKCGLINGNMFGLLRADDDLEKAVPTGMGLIYDSALSCALWSLEKYYFRYRGLCLKHKFKEAGGYASVERNANSRRDREDRLLRRLQRRYPKLVHFRRKPRASNSTMQQHFCQVGPEPLQLQKWCAPSSGRPREGFTDRAMTDAERQRKRRHGRQAVLPAKVPR